MLSLLVFLLVLYQLQRPIYSEIASTSRSNLNALTIQDGPDSIISSELFNDSETDTNDIPFVKSGPDQTEIQFRRPISAVNIDYPKNLILLKFRHHQFLDPNELERRKSLEENFMRFGRDKASNFMRFGKRSIEQTPKKNNIERFERSAEGFNDVEKLGLRDSRGDNFMRFGRDPKHDYMRPERNPAKDFMRFGRNTPQNFMRLGRNPGKEYMRFGRNDGEDYMRLGRNPGKEYMRFGEDFMRLGRSPSEDYMRFGRSPAQDYMRFGRSPAQDYMRFGRSSAQDYMRFGRSPAQDYMRFGRNPAQDYMRFGRSPGDFMRLGRGSAKEFMRFGRSDIKDKDFMRFGRTDAEPNTAKSSNFMRFGRMNEISGQSTEKISDKESNHTSSRTLQKNDVKEAAKLLRETDASNEESNPMDKAIEVLFSNHDDEQTEQHKDSEDNTSQEIEY